MFDLKVPVLLIAFNRPDTTKQVFERIRIAKPEKLYIALDGSRRNAEGNQELCREVNNIVKNVDWPCEAYYKINIENLGAETTIFSAISWVFEKEEYAIILEDDIIAPLSFFKFMQEMLLRYKDNNRIGTVTGSNFTPINLKNNEDYFIAKYGHSWGWGTWRRAWKDYVLNVEIPNDHLKTKFLEKITNSKSELKYYRKLFKNMQRKGPGNNTWDAVGLYYHRINNSLSVIPRVNLTSNIGVYGVHAKGKTEHHYRPIDENFEVEKHPAKVECNIEYDKYHFKTYINKKKSLYRRVFHKFKKLVSQPQYK